MGIILFNKGSCRLGDRRRHFLPCSRLHAKLYAFAFIFQFFICPNTIRNLFANPFAVPFAIFIFCKRNCKQVLCYLLCILLYFTLLDMLSSVCKISPSFINSENKRETLDRSFSCNFNSIRASVLFIVSMESK